MRYKIVFSTTLFILLAFAVFGILRISSVGTNAQQLIVADAESDVTKSSTNKDQSVPLNWSTIVNNGYLVPGSESNFSSYGQPSVNTRGVVVFRGRSTGSSERQAGIYKRQNLKSAVQSVADLETYVPFPNNLNAQFIEFPAIPRIAMNESIIATRGIHKPVYKYNLPDGTETRVGTTGLYVEIDNDPLITGGSKVGIAPEFKMMGVPKTDGAAFTVFPGAPAVNDKGVIAFKGNYTVDNHSKTGIFFRNLLNTPGGGKYSVEQIASSDTDIPNAPPSFRPFTFGSTAPPTIAGDEVVFLGLDNEEFPNYGGIFVAELTPEPELKTLIGIREPLPGNDLPELNRIGEGLSYDGRYLAFWGAWGEATKTIRLYCPVDGNADLIAYCNGVDPNSVYDRKAEAWYQEKQVPVNQGIFVLDRGFNRVHLIANSAIDFTDFVFWGYSGKAPGTGSDEDAEPPRWRSAAFVTVSDGFVAFKARIATLTNKNIYVDIVDGIYLAEVLGAGGLTTVVKTGIDGGDIDPEIRGREMPVSGMGIEREGLRGGKLAITVTMANAEESWGGIYLTDINRGQPTTIRTTDGR